MGCREREHEQSKSTCKQPQLFASSINLWQATNQGVKGATQLQNH